MEVNKNTRYLKCICTGSIRTRYYNTYNIFSAGCKYIRHPYHKIWSFIIYHQAVSSVPWNSNNAITSSKIKKYGFYSCFWTYVSDTLYVRLFYRHFAIVTMTYEGHIVYLKIDCLYILSFIVVGDIENGKSSTLKGCIFPYVRLFVHIIRCSGYQYRYLLIFIHFNTQLLETLLIWKSTVLNSI